MFTYYKYIGFILKTFFRSEKCLVKNSISSDELQWVERVTLFHCKITLHPVFEKLSPCLIPVYVNITVRV